MGYIYIIRLDRRRVAVHCMRRDDHSLWLGGRCLCGDEHGRGGHLRLYCGPWLDGCWRCFHAMWRLNENNYHQDQQGQQQTTENSVGLFHWDPPRNDV